VRSVDRLAIFVDLGIVLLVVPASARASSADAGAPRVSFDCAKASTRVEKMICSDDESAALDGQLAETYRRALADPAENSDEIKIDQRAWLSGKRNKCGDVSCLRRRYRERIAALEAPMRPTEVEIRSGTAPVCEPLREEVLHRWPVLHGVHKPTTLQKIAWKEADTSSLPRELYLGEAEEQSFDFDNDGVPDRVFQVEFENHYMEGTVLLVQRGPKLTDRWLLPCQLDARTIAVEECPPFSQKYDEAGLAMRGATAKEKVFFRGRYAELTVFRFEQSTFVAVEDGWSKDSSDETVRHVAVIKPLAGKKFERSCLLRVSGAF